MLLNVLTSSGNDTISKVSVSSDERSKERNKTKPVDTKMDISSGRFSRKLSIKGCPC